MHGLRRWLAASLVASMSGVVQVPVALADERTDARREFRAGMQAVAEGRYDDGITHLENAYDILPHPNVLYNLGLAHMYAGRPDDAITYFERYRETAPPSDAAEVDALIAGLRGKEAAAEAQASQASQAAEQADVASAIETAAREVRRIAEESQNADLKKQADELDATAKAMRADQPLPGADAQPQPAQPTPAPSGAQAGQQAKRAGVYEEEVVSASRFAQSPLDAPNATAIITAQDIRMTGLTNVTDLLRRVGGVEVNQVTPSHAEVSIRGLNRRTSNKVLILLDGRSQRLDFLGTAWYNQIPVNVEDIERIEIIRGPASALYGADAFSGIINVITRRPGEGSSFVAGGAGTNNQARGVASFTGRSGKLAYHYGFGYRQLDNAVVPVGPDRVDVLPATDNGAIANQAAWSNGTMTYDFKRGTKAEVGANFYYGTNTLQGLSRLGQVTAPDSSRIGVHGALTTPAGIKLSSWWERIDGNNGPSYVTPGAINQVSRDIVQQVADVDLAWSGRFKLLVPQTFTIGGGYRYKFISWTYLDANHTQHHAGGYIQDVIELAKPLTLQIGARLDYHPLLPDLQFSPRGSLVYRFLEQQSLRVSIGRAFRGPSFLESYLDLPNDTPLRGITAYGLGNDKLDPESIVSYELGYQNQESDYFALEANVYFNMVTDAILFTNPGRYPLSDYVNGSPGAGFDESVDAFAATSLRFTNERATFRQIGGELGVRFYPMPGLDVFSNYSVHDTSPTGAGDIDPVRAREQQTSLHKVNAGVQYRAQFGLDVGADVSWFSSQLWVEQVTDVERGVRYEALEQPAFTMVNGRLGYRFWDERLDVGVVGTNLAFQDKRQHPYGQPIDTRVLGTAKLRF
jgi:outer membrane receptor for ferrienterochelin and colicin